MALSHEMAGTLGRSLDLLRPIVLTN
jgi:hypothetical protein